jgi:hypothetical protein
MYLLINKWMESETYVFCIFSFKVFASLLFMLLTDDGCETKPHAAGNYGSWKNVVILILLMLVFGLWCRLSMCKNC